VIALPDVAYRVIGWFSTTRFYRVVHPIPYRRFGGRGILGRVIGSEMLLLTTTGRRSGRPRTVALFEFADGIRDGDRELSGDDYEAAFATAARACPGYRVYRRRSPIHIPVLRLEPRPGGPP
jgi:hypothetical protein